MRCGGRWRDSICGIRAQPAKAPSELPVSRTMSSGVRTRRTTMWSRRPGMTASVRRMNVSAIHSLSRSQSRSPETSVVGHSSLTACMPGGARSGWWNVAT